MPTDDNVSAEPESGQRNDVSTRLPSPPAAGERRAIRGYAAQYRFAAARILSAIRGAGLEWIRIADPDAGRVDDLQIGRPNRVDGYQVKWSLFPGALTFHGVTQDVDEKPSLLRQLADGWERLRRANPGNRVVVHLVSNDNASVSDAVAGIAGTSRARGSFAAFLLEAWARAQTTIEAGNPLTISSMPGGAVWQAAWDEMREASGLTEEAWLRFIPDCSPWTLERPRQIDLP